MPSTLVALCLNEKGLERVKESKALDCFVPIFTTPTYLRALQVSFACCLVPAKYSPVQVSAHLSPGIPLL